MSAPYETEREAAAVARHITESPPESWRDGSLRLLEDACRNAGVEVGAYDYKILVWLTGFEPSMCAVVAGLITRAHASQAETRQLAGIRAVLDAFDWEFDDRQYALEHIERIATGDEQ